MSKLTEQHEISYAELIFCKINVSFGHSQVITDIAT
jgi:hypothetical protein